ncbi:hypothetical protein MRB53_032530 [Persea americana]|uniref:Uncharacterized protein n=1 Tax=Persea americana TaxID=3435 RepID=A0ACC2KS48_PERAE|nr:hypothetical protein MRB53_032530 [Persea americana]
MATRGVDDGSQGKDFHEMEGSEGSRNTIFVEFVSSMKIRDLESEYYYDPVNHQRFRSKKEVERFLKMETVKKYETKSLEVEPTTDNLQSTLRLDLKNPPTMVSWVLSNFAEGVWTPYINSEEVSESTRNSWVTAMEGINNSANQFQE